MTPIIVKCLCLHVSPSMDHKFLQSYSMFISTLFPALSSQCYSGKNKTINKMKGPSMEGRKYLQMKHRGGRREELPHVQGQGRQPRGATLRTAKRSYPANEVRGGGREELHHAPTPEAKGGGREELPYARGQGRRPGGPTECPRSCGCSGTGGP